MTSPLLTLEQLQIYLREQAVADRKLSTLSRWSRDRKNGHRLIECVAQRRPTLFVTEKINSIFIRAFIKANVPNLSPLNIRQTATGVREIPKRKKAKQKFY